MKIPELGLTAVIVAALSGCVVAPVGVRPGYGGPVHGGQVYGGPVQAEPEYVVPPGVVFIAPTYALPAPGYYWRHHARFGWGWRHRAHGWPRGWR